MRTLAQSIAPGHSLRPPAREVTLYPQPPSTSIPGTALGSLRGGATVQLIEIDFEETDGVTMVRFAHSGLRDEHAALTRAWTGQGLRQPRSHARDGLAQGCHARTLS